MERPANYILGEQGKSQRSMFTIAEPESSAGLKCPQCTTPARNRKTELALPRESAALCAILLPAEGPGKTSGHVEFQSGGGGSRAGPRARSPWRLELGQAKPGWRRRRCVIGFRWPHRARRRRCLIRSDDSFFRYPRWSSRRSKAVPENGRLCSFPFLPKRNSLRHWHEHFILRV
jgi:hypothetical protein